MYRNKNAAEFQRNRIKTTRAEIQWLIIAVRSSHFDQLESSSSFHNTQTVGRCEWLSYLRSLLFILSVQYRMAVAASLLRSVMWKWSSVSAWLALDLLKWMHIGPTWKWTTECHILWDTCKDASPVGWNNQAAGISWQSCRQRKVVYIQGYLFLTAEG